jgi:signal transduction histidine kinase
MSSITNMQLGKNGAYVAARILMLIGFSLAIYIIQPRTINSFASVQDIAIPAIIGLIGAAAVGMLSLVKSIKPYIAGLVLIGDWALVAAYLYYNPGLNSFLLFSILGIIMVSGTLRLGSTLGAIHNVGAFIAFAVALAFAPNMSFDLLRRNLMLYAPGAAMATVMALLAHVWYNSLNEEGSTSSRQIRQEVEEARKRLESMRERAKAFSEMATRLNSTLNYDRILDAALDVGRLSVRDDDQSKVVSMALMIGDEDMMDIASERGLHHSDLHNKFAGASGIIARAIDEGVPLIINGGENDSELRKLRAFKGIQTTLCIPLRAHYETYGVLIFGTAAANAIHEDHIDTLEAIGVQTALALRNAVLYTNLREEKERIVQIEENGRRALVRDLHDIPTQTVSAVAMHLSTLPLIAERKPETLRAEVENIRQMALRATEEIRHVMFTLRPLALETQGLVAALDQLAQKMEQTYKQPMRVKFDPRVEQVLKKEAHGTLFYLVEEAANNARKYAQASMIQVSGNIEGSSVVVRIRDNGKGFDMGAVDSGYENRGSFGMVNMRERAELINGRFEMKSAPGKGTEVIVRVPITDTIPSASKTGASSEGSTKPLKQPRNALKKKQYSGPLSPSK